MSLIVAIVDFILPTRDMTLWKSQMHHCDLSHIGPHDDHVPPHLRTSTSVPNRTSPRVTEKPTIEPLSPGIGWGLDKI